MIVNNNHFRDLPCYLWGFSIFLLITSGVMGALLFVICGAVCFVFSGYMVFYIRFLRSSISEVRLGQEEFSKSVDTFLQEYLSSDVENPECVICMEDFSLKEWGQPVGIKCSCRDTYYHRKCIVEWLLKKSTCPICRTDLKSKTIMG